MKTLRYFANIAFMTSLAIFASCSSDNDIEENNGNSENPSAEKLVFTATFESDEATRATLVKESNSIERMHWEAGDQIAVYSGSAGPGVFTATSIDASNTKAEFSGVNLAGTYYCAIYPANLSNLSFEKAKFTANISANQVVTNGYSYDRSAIMMTARTTPSEKKFEFKNVPALLKFTLTNNNGKVRYIKVYSNVGGKAMAGTFNTFTNPNTGAITVDGVTNYQDYVQLEIPQGTSEGTFYIATIPGTPLNGGFTILLESELESGSQSIYKRVYSGDITFIRSNIYDMGTYDISSVSFMDNVVDLGLPSRTLWCTKNITYSGTSTTFVNSIYDNGGYYAWGEIYAWGQDNGKTTYSSNTYTLGSDIYTSSTLKKQNDAAYQIEGHAFCMPTYDQIYELYDKCTLTYKISSPLNGHYGVQITSNSNGRTLWLPAAGYHCDAGSQSGLNSENSVCHYWSRSLYTGVTSTDYAHCLDFKSSGLDEHGWLQNLVTGSRTWYDRRFAGKSIRPVVLDTKIAPIYE